MVQAIANADTSAHRSAPVDLQTNPACQAIPDWAILPEPDCVAPGLDELNTTQSGDPTFCQVPDDPTPTPTAQPTTVSSDVTFTNLRMLDGEEHEALKSLIFWSIFNESSEGRHYYGGEPPTISNIPESRTYHDTARNLANFLVNDPYCTSTKSNMAPDEPPNDTLNWDPQIEELIHCYDYRYLDAHYSINAILRNEREQYPNYDLNDPTSTMGAIYSHFYANFGGTFGSFYFVKNRNIFSNMTFCTDDINLPSTLPSFDGSNTYTYQSWNELLGDIVYLNDLYKRRSQYDRESEGYRSITDTLRNYPARPLLQGTAVEWLHGFVSCNLQRSPDTNLPERVQLTQPLIISQINVAISEMYLQMDDPTCGATERKFANFRPADGQESFSYTLRIDDVAYSNYNVGSDFNSVNLALISSFYSDGLHQSITCGLEQSEIAVTRERYDDWQYSDLLSCYRPLNSSLVVPLLGLDYIAPSDENNFRSTITGYEYTAVVYQTTDQISDCREHRQYNQPAPRN